MNPSTEPRNPLRTQNPKTPTPTKHQQVFLTDKKLLKTFGTAEPMNRIKKEFLKEIKQLKPGERVLILGNSKEPQLCVKKDEKAFLSFWNKHIFCPVPDYASRRLIWPGLYERHGARLPYEFDLCTLAHITDGYSSGAIDLAIRALLTERRRETFKRQPTSIAELIQWLARLPQLSAETDDALRKWRDKTPAFAAIRAAAAAALAPPGTAGKDAKGKDAKKKK